MAAEYINSVINGKLNAAKKSLHLSGKWSGSAVAAGYMVDSRKKLPNGSDNAHHRKYVPFEPYAEVIRAYFEIFIACNGNLAKTARHIQQQGPYFPDPKTCLPPDGFRFVYKIKQYPQGWYPKSKPALIQIFTNAVYIGHWISGGVIVQWNNHPAIVSEETFFKAFNFLSNVTITGDDNPNYLPTQPKLRLRKNKDRQADEPLLSVLVYGQLDNGQWKRLGTRWINNKKRYDYVLTADDGIYTQMWGKKANYIDSTVTALLIEKLKKSFDISEWENAVKQSYAKHIEQKRIIEAQLDNLSSVMENLLTSLGTISNPHMIIAVEQRYQAAALEKERLQNELQIVITSATEDIKLTDMQASFRQIVENWNELSVPQKRTVVQAFVAKIELNKLGTDAHKLVIYWKDDSKDTLHIGHIASKGVTWLPQQTELLIKLAESGATKLEIAKAFPDLSWRTIYNRYSTITGKKKPRENINTIQKHETYNQYLHRVEIGRLESVTEVDSW